LDSLLIPVLASRKMSRVLATFQRESLSPPHNRAASFSKGLLKANVTDSHIHWKMVRSCLGKTQKLSAEPCRRQRSLVIDCNLAAGFLHNHELIRLDEKYNFNQSFQGFTFSLYSFLKGRIVVILRRDF